MAVFDNLNKTTSSGVAAGVQDYYNAKIQKVLKETLVHSRDAQKVPLPEHNGKFVRFRKPTKLNPITTPLTEGVTPAGQTITLTDFRAMVKPYGGHIELTDEINFYLLDNMQMMAADLLAEQARESLDAILRLAFNAGTNVYYTGGKTVRSGLSATEKLDGATLKKVVRYMEKNSVPKFGDGFYHSIIGPETKFDLMDIGLLTDKAKYQSMENVEKYEVGVLYGIKFFETPKSHTFSAGTYVVDALENIQIDAYNATTRVATITTGQAAITPDVARKLAGLLVDVTNTHTTATNNTLDTLCIEYVEPTNGTSAFIHFRWGLPAASAAKVAASGYSSKIVPTGGGAAGIKIHSTLVYGQDAFGTVSLGGSGDNVQTIVNPPGSSGALDPLNQRATVAWKVNGFCGVILDQTRVCRIEHGVSV